MQILNQDYSLREDEAHFLAYFCEGRIGAALRFKDADILREKNRVIDDFTLLNKSGFDSLTTDNRDDVRGYLGILTSWFRDLYLIKIGLLHSQLINYDRKAQLLKAMGRYTLLDLDEIIRCISDSLVYLEQNVNIKLLLSNLRAELCRR
jgi:hypothetical protein